MHFFSTNNVPLLVYKNCLLFLKYMLSMPCQSYLRFLYEVDVMFRLLYFQQRAPLISAPVFQAVCDQCGGLTLLSSSSEGRDQVLWLWSLFFSFHVHGLCTLIELKGYEKY